jgi:DNA-binding NarL/FixJ family response regulator
LSFCAQTALSCIVRKILILDEHTPGRDALVAHLRELASAEIVLAADAANAIAQLRSDDWAAVLVESSLIAIEFPSLLAALRAAAWRPLVVLVTDEPDRDLDPDLISLIVREPYDVPMVTGVLLAAITDVADGASPDGAGARPRR